MFENPGRKLMVVAKVILWLGVVGTVLVGALIVLLGLNVGGAEVKRVADVLSLTAAPDVLSAVVAAAITLIVGLLASWVLSLSLCALARLVENSDKVAASVRPPIEAPQLRQTVK